VLCWKAGIHGGVGHDAVAFLNAMYQARKSDRLLVVAGARSARARAATPATGGPGEQFEAEQFDPSQIFDTRELLSKLGVRVEHFEAGGKLARACALATEIEELPSPILDAGSPAVTITPGALLGDRTPPISFVRVAFSKPCSLSYLPQRFSFLEGQVVVRDAAGAPSAVIGIQAQ